MNPLLQDKCAARRIDRAGCVEALGITRVTRGIEAATPRSNAERVQSWRSRAGVPGFATGYVRPYQAKPRAPVVDCPQPDAPPLAPGALIYVSQVMPATADTPSSAFPLAQTSAAAGSQAAPTAGADARGQRAPLRPAAPDDDAAFGNLSCTPDIRPCNLREARIVRLARAVENLARAQHTFERQGQLFEAHECRFNAARLASRALKEAKA